METIYSVSPLSNQLVENMADPINLHEDEQPFELSPFILAIMKIAREEGDYISEQTLREFWK